MQVLLEHNADVHTRLKGGWTPLHSAARPRNPDPEIIRLLLEHEASVDSKTDLGATPLHVLLHHSGDLEAAQILLEGGADPNIQPMNSERPLYTALKKGPPGLVQLLLNHRADPEARDDINETLLHTASIIGDPKVAQGLLKLKVDVNSRGYNGRTPLQLALRHNQEHIVRLLIQHGAEEDNPMQIELLVPPTHWDFMRVGGSLRYPIATRSDVAMIGGEGVRAVKRRLVERNLWL